LKGIILAGGNGTRLMPLTSVTNKHLLPVGKKPMIVHCVEKLTEINIKDVMVVTGTDHMGAVVSLLGSGAHLGCNFTYRVQENPDGIAGALKLCRDFCGDEDLCVILGDNIFKNSLVASRMKFDQIKSNPKCLLNLAEVKDPERFGVASLKNNKVVKITEKPKNPESNLCVTGIYFYDKHVFDVIERIKKSSRGEYEITDVNNFYISNGLTSYFEFDQWWTDAGTHTSYQKANFLLSSE
jgi:glucose-1-phosphate thymidylyltransferase